MKESNESRENEHRKTLEHLNANRSDLDNLMKQRPSLDEQYTFYQEMRSFVRDFVDCYNEKIEEIEKAEKRWLEFHKQRSQQRVQMRQQEVKDLNIECSNCKRSFNHFKVHSH